jgi:hypothetical protein
VAAANGSDFGRAGGVADVTRCATGSTDGGSSVTDGVTATSTDAESVTETDGSSADQDRCVTNQGRKDRGVTDRQSVTETGDHRAGRTRSTAARHRHVAGSKCYDPLDVFCRATQSAEIVTTTVAAAAVNLIVVMQTVSEATPTDLDACCHD